MAKSKATDQSVQGEAEVQTTQSAPSPEAPGLELQDLAMVLNLLNTSIKRGAFEPNELTTVGNVYGKLEKFLQYQAQMQAAAQAAAQKGEA